MACSSSYSKYTLDKPPTYTYNNGRQNIDNQLSPLYFDLESGHPIQLSFIFSEALPRAEKLRSVEIKLFARRNDSDPYTREIPLKQSNLEAEYWNGKDIVKVAKDNFRGDFASLLDPSLKDYKYRDSNVVHFTLHNDYAEEDHPETLRQVIILHWMDREDQVFTTTLTKVTHSKSCVSGRPYG